MVGFVCVADAASVWDIPTTNIRFEPAATGNETVLHVPETWSYAFVQAVGCVICALVIFIPEKKITAIMCKIPFRMRRDFIIGYVMLQAFILLISPGEFIMTGLNITIPHYWIFITKELPCLQNLQNCYRQQSYQRHQLIRHH